MSVLSSAAPLEDLSSPCPLLAALDEALSPHSISVATNSRDPMGESHVSLSHLFLGLCLRVSDLFPSLPSQSDLRNGDQQGEGGGSHTVAFRGGEVDTLGSDHRTDMIGTWGTRSEAAETRAFFQEKTPV